MLYEDLKRNSGEGSEDHNIDRKVDSKVMLMRFQMEVRILMGIELEVYYGKKNG